MSNSQFNKFKPRISSRINHEKDATAIRKHCHQNEHHCSVDDFEILGTAVNDFHLKLKKYLVILIMKSCLNIAQESMALYLFDNASWNAIGK